MPRFTRREALTGAAASWLIVKPGIAFGSHANSAVSFGIIGTGGRGQLVGGYISKNDHTRLTAICDIYPDVIDEAKTKIPGTGALVTSRDFYEWRGTPERDETNVPRAQQGLIKRVESKRDVTIDATGAFIASIVEGKHFNMAAIASESTMTAVLGRMTYEFDREVRPRSDLGRDVPLGLVWLLHEWCRKRGSNPHAQ